MTLGLLVAILGVGATMGGLALRGIAHLKNDLTKITDRLSGQIESVQKELRDELKGDIAGVRDELKGEVVGLRDRIDAVRSETVETRMVVSDRVARLEGSVFGIPLPDTGADLA